MMQLKLGAARETRAARLFNTLFGTAIVTIFVIRSFLALTGYPQLGGGNVHVAHMLYGGVLMLAAIIGLLYLHGYRAKIVLAVVAGVGFGFFIDELGKFITSNGDYFYQPAAMLIYIVFIFLWALLSWLDNYVATTEQQRAVDALTLLRDGIIYGSSSHQELAIKKQLLLAGLSETNSKKFIEINRMLAPQVSKNGAWSRYAKRINRYKKQLEVFAAAKYTQIALQILIIFQAMYGAVLLFRQVLTFVSEDRIDITVGTPDFILLGIVVCSAAAFVLTAFGALQFGRNRTKMFVWYRRALLVNIFGTQAFLFFVNQFEAGFGLVANLLLLWAVSYLIELEKIKK